jgi:ubiquinone/menaquinone biosynthesis C-methylase UbiE
MAAEKYVLATGEEGAYRLRIVQAVHGADTQAFLRRAGLKSGMRVADIGCGVGILSVWIAQQVGESGEVIGVDVSPEQIATAEQTVQAEGVGNARFRTASAYATGLETDYFDLVFSRFLLMHLQRPFEALREMRRILKPNGILAVEDGDFTSPFCWPPSPAFGRCFEIYRLAGERHQQQFLMGQKLYGLVREAGFQEPQVALAQPAFARGEAKRLPEWTLAEGAPAFIEAGLTTQTEIDTLVTELARLAADEGTLFGMARMTQVWARK